jgi:GAF domain-containing protein/type IV secretory pathway TrbD component
MPIQSSGLTLSIPELSARLLEKHEVVPRARVIAQMVSALFPGCAVNLYGTATVPEGEVWMLLASVGEVSVPEPTIPLDTGTLGILAGALKPFRFEGKTLVREEYAHLHVGRTLHCLSYLPIVDGDQLIGAIEILSFDEKMSLAQLESLAPIAEVSGAALKAARIYEEERQNTLSSITRLTQLYDIEKVFSSTLEMDQLFPIIGSKVREMLECEAVNVWLLEPDESLRMVHQAGVDLTVQERALQRPGEGIAGDISDNGEGVLIQQEDDPRLLRRNQEIPQEEKGVVSLIAAPLLDQEALVGVMEATNPLDYQPFDEDDLFTLTRLAESASIALHNASLLAAERKVEVLETLVHVSHEITSTLNLERMLQTIVNAPQAVIPYERAAIALELNGKYKLSAVTGSVQVDAESPEVAPLSSVLQWALLSGGTVHIRQHEGEIDDSREETRAKFKDYFEKTGMRGFYGVPLTDDTGRVGILGLESPDPDFLTPAHIEILQVLAGQATVALRNAQMYKEVPFISVLEPVLEKKRKFMAMGKHRRILIIAGVIAVAVFLAVFPWPLRVDGDAMVAPVHSAQVQSAVEGVVTRVTVREGEHVVRDQVIGELGDWEAQANLAQARAKYQTALLQMNHALADNDGTQAGMQRVQADFWRSEVARDEDLLDKTRLRSPIDGVVATPHIETMVGRRLQHGDNADAGLLRTGSRASVKLNSFPVRTFRGDVIVVSPKATLLGEARVFYARVAIPNPDGSIRAGMEGRAKVRVGWYPAGYALFRGPLLWLYSKAWSWFGV